VDADFTDAFSDDGSVVSVEEGVAPPTGDPDAEDIIDILGDTQDVNAFGDKDRHGYFLLTMFEDRDKGVIPNGAMMPRELVGSDNYDRAETIVFCEEISTAGAHHCHMFYKGPRMTRSQIKTIAQDNGYLVKSQELKEIQAIHVNRGPLSKKSKYHIALAMRYCSEGYKTKKTQLDGFHYVVKGRFDNKDPITWANKTIAEYNAEAQKVKDRLEKAQAKAAKSADAVPVMSTDDALEYVEPFMPTLQLWMDTGYVFHCLVLTAKDDKVLRRCLDKFKSKIKDLINNRLNEVPLPNRLNEGIILLCGAARTGKSTYARSYCKERWGDTAEFAGAPPSTLYHVENWSGAKRGFWEYSGAPGFIVDEAETNSVGISIFKRCFDKGNWGGNKYFGLEKKNDSTINANHSMAILTTNVAPTQLYRNVFAENHDHYIAVRDRLTACFWSPFWRINEGTDFSDLEKDSNGNRVRNIIEVDEDGILVRDAQRIDVLPIIKDMDYLAATEYFRKIRDQGFPRAAPTPQAATAGNHVIHDHAPPSKRYKYAIQGNPEPGHRSW